MKKTDLRVREWSALKFHDPVHVLRGFRRVEDSLRELPAELRELSPRALHLRTNALKPHREGRDAALFAHGMATVLGTKVHFAPVERSDYDFVTGCGLHDTFVYTPVQLKEYAPAGRESLSELLNDLGHYSQTDTVLAVRLNRRETVDLRGLEIPKLPFSEVWFFWCASEDQSVWTIYGDLLRDPRGFEFRYPEEGD